MSNLRTFRILSVVALLTASIGFTAAPGQAAVYCLGKRATKVGTSANNTIYGTQNADVIAGLGGRDTIYGYGGNDTICGGDGDDYLMGDEGNDNMICIA